MTHASFGEDRQVGGESEVKTVSIYRIPGQRFTSLVFCCFIFLWPLVGQMTRAFGPKDARMDAGSLIAVGLLTAVCLVAIGFVTRRGLVGHLSFDRERITIKGLWGPQISIPWEGITSISAYSKSGVSGFVLAIDVSGLADYLLTMPCKQRRKVSKCFVFGPDLVLISTADFNISADQLRAEIETYTKIVPTFTEGIESLTVTKPFDEQFREKEIPAKATWGASFPQKLSWTVGLAVFTLLWWLLFTTGAGNAAPYILTTVFLTIVTGAFLVIVWQQPSLRFDENGVIFKGCFVPRVQVKWHDISFSHATVNLTDNTRTLELWLADQDSFLAPLTGGQRKSMDSRVASQGIIVIPLARLGVLPQDLQPEIRKRINTWKSSQSKAGEA